MSREIDALVAMKIMGLAIRPIAVSLNPNVEGPDIVVDVKDEPGVLLKTCPHYSTNMADFGELLRKLEHDWVYIEMSFDGAWTVQIYYVTGDDDKTTDKFEASALTIMEAGCKAALKMKGVEV